MGLDQYLFYNQVNLSRPGDNTTEIACWRKDWGLQEFINTGNCESLDITIELCDDILDSLDSIYQDNDYYKSNTFNAFTRAKKFLLNNQKVTYEADW